MIDDILAPGDIDRRSAGDDAETEDQRLVVAGHQQPEHEQGKIQADQPHDDQLLCRLYAIPANPSERGQS